MIEFFNLNVIAFIDRNDGLCAREYFNIEKHDSLGSPVQVLIPDNTKALSTSFFIGMFEDSIKKSDNPHGFLSKYQFLCKEHISTQIRNSLNRYSLSLKSADMNTI